VNDEKPTAPEGYAALRTCYPDGSCIWIMVPEAEYDRLATIGQLPLMITARMDDQAAADPE